MKSLFYFILIFLAPIFLGAQFSSDSSSDCDPIDDLTTGFEQCALDANGIANGCAQGWFPSAGSPAILSNITGIIPHSGNRMVVLATTNFGGCRAESMFLSVPNLIPGEQYELSVWVHTQNSGNPSAGLGFTIDYTSGIAVNSTPLGFGSCLPVSSTPLFASTNYVATNWTNITIPFTAQAGLDQIHFVPRPNVVDNTRILIDDVTVSFCDPCEGVDVDAFFRLNAEFITPNLYRIRPALFNTYSSIGGQHTWVIYRSDQPNGPFTYQQTYNSTNFTFNARPGYYYTVFHKVETECGTACYGWNICEGCGEGVLPELCEYCGPIDCSLIDEPCTFATPEPFGCWYFSPWGTIVGWTSLPGASYQVQFYPFGDCCDESQFFWPFIVPANDNVLNPPANAGNCFRFRVRAVCDKSVSDWSDFQCVNLNECNFWEYRPSEEIDPSIDLGYMQVESEYLLPDAELVAIPNPTNRGYVDLSFNNLIATTYAQLTVFSLDGKVVANRTLSAETLSSGTFRLDFNNLNLGSGTYIARLSTGQDLLTTRFIVTN
ncbi:MAG: T9SS type A sorting domain-containing protein [Bacteroidota bacterium]